MIHDCLRQGRLKSLFIEELGWDHAQGDLTVELEGRWLELRKVAQKRGFLVLEHRTERRWVQTRRFIRALSQKAAAIAHEHLLIVLDPEATVQVWVWSQVDRLTGRRRYRMHHFFADRLENRVVRRISKLLIRLEEEEGLSLTDVIRRTAGTLDGQADNDIFFRKPRFAQRSDELAGKLEAGGTEDFHAFVRFHQRLARWMAGRYSHLDVDLEDMAQIATIGLIRAARRFKPSRGTAFSTYAFHAMRRECDRALARITPIYPIPHHLYCRYTAVMRKLDRVRMRRGNHAAFLEYESMIQEVKISPALSVNLHRVFQPQSLEDLPEQEWNQYADPADNLHELCGIICGRNPLGELLSQEIMTRLSVAIGKLEERDQKIIQLRYGLGSQAHTLEATGDIVGLTKERVRQLEMRILANLRIELSTSENTPSARDGDDPMHAQSGASRLEENPPQLPLAGARG